MTFMSSVFVLQANELGMMSAFYKYILTTMVRSSSCSLSATINPLTAA